MRRGIAIAVCAIAVAALPASASAYTSNWKMEENELTEHGTMTLTGTFGVTGGWVCHIHMHFSLEAGSGTGYVEEALIPGPESCELTETLASVCTEVSNAVSPLPWMLDDEGGSIAISGVMASTTFAGGLFCPSEVTMEGAFAATPDNTAEIHSLTLSGALSTSLGTENVFGELEVVAGSGTYGL